MPDDLESLTNEELLERVRRLEQGGALVRNSPFDAHSSPRRQEEQEYASNDEWRHSFERRFNAGTRGTAIRYGGNTAQFSVQEAEKYVKELGATRLAVGLARNSSKPAVRDAFSKMKPETW